MCEKTIELLRKCYEILSLQIILLFRKRARLSHRDETEPKCGHGQEHREHFNELSEPTEPGEERVVDSAK